MTVANTRLLLQHRQEALSDIAGCWVRPVNAVTAELLGDSFRVHEVGPACASNGMTTLPRTSRYADYRLCSIIDTSEMLAAYDLLLCALRLRESICFFALGGNTHSGLWALLPEPDCLTGLGQQVASGLVREECLVMESVNIRVLDQQPPPPPTCARPSVPLYHATHPFAPARYHTAITSALCLRPAPWCCRPSPHRLQELPHCLTHSRIAQLMLFSIFTVSFVV